MDSKYREYKGLNLTEINKEVLSRWQKEKTFEQSLKLREGKTPFVFYEGPPSANGQPGIHHVMARTIKDIFCRYKSQKGYYVARKAGWDTHGLPVELGVEKNLGITKEDIGKKISVDDYNAACRAEVMKYKDLWDKLTIEMGYWVDLDNPYITFKNEYIETLWYLLSVLYQKGFMYKGYTIQPYSPAAGTGLSSHELNMPGCYRDVKDTTVTAQFKIKNTGLYNGVVKRFVEEKIEDNTYFLAWTTTPWTLPSNTALAVGANIDYLWVKTFNPYNSNPIVVVLAKALLNAYFSEKNAEIAFEDYKAGDKAIPFKVLGQCKGKDLIGIEYEQLLPFVLPLSDAFKVIVGDYVTTEDGTGIVHIAPTFGADDDRVAKAANIPPLVLIDKDEKRQPMVDRTGKYFKIEDLDEAFVKNYVNIERYSEYAGRYVKNDYDKNLSDKDATTLDIDLCVALKQEGKAFKIEKLTHNYPHCWRTDKPVLYYPLDSWFIRTTKIKDRLIELNKTINWKPEATGSGRFGNWLENLVDWNLSRSRYWGTPLPIWRTEDGKEEICIGSVQMLSKEIDKSVVCGFMTENKYKSEDYNAFDLHRPYIDDVVLVSPTGHKMYRESDLIDVWFDSGAMPYAQVHYPFECSDTELRKNFPADFIAEGVDQTRGWFFTLHAISSLVFDTIAFKNVVSNGLVLDKNGNKMSKRLGNGVNPFDMIGKYGADATRWYMISNSQPWENLKFDEEGIDEVRRKFFGTLYNTYSFFALYANIDGFTYKEEEIDIKQRPEIDRWILSELNSLIELADSNYTQYEPTRVARAIANFVDEYLSNWYVRLCRRRFWKGEYSEDKISAYQTLYTCMITIAKLSAPIAPFFAEQLFTDLNAISGKEAATSVHLTDFPKSNADLIDKDLEQRMQLAQKICSLVLSLRKKNNLKVRQPLSKIIIPTNDEQQRQHILSVKNLICSEVNIKDIEFLDASNNILIKKIKANFKTLGPKYGSKMKSIAAALESFEQADITSIEQEGKYSLTIGNEAVEILLSDVEIFTQDIPGWVVANEGSLTIALDITITDHLHYEGIARELINRIQNIRKQQDFEVTDKIEVVIQSEPSITATIDRFHDYICSETLTSKLALADSITNPTEQIDVVEGKMIAIKITKS
ncbi:MAG: isoleucine--tRNA ligase [Bacteroidales bacterium]|jgi:isoleucyl-tRNA synthetase|nr:isoleucine--tRNA ligase [Bacteroidales bacterium]